MARILTEHLESGDFSEARVVNHNMPTTTRAAVKDSAVFGVSGDGSRRWIQMGNIAAESFVDLQLFANYTEVYGEVWFYSPTIMTTNSDQIIRFYKDTTQLASPLLTNDNKWASFIFGSGAGSTGSVFGTWGVWHCMEFYYKISATVGELTFKIDGVVAATLSGNTVSGGNLNFNRIRLFSSLTAELRLDGLVVNDTTTAEDNTWPGIILVASRDPNADMGAHPDWSQTGVGAKYLVVSEYPDDQGTYIYSVVDAQKQGFTFPAFNVPSNSVPIAVITEDTAAMVSAGTLFQWQKLGATELTSAAKTLGVDLKIVQFRRTKDPTGAAWTLANANASSAFVESNL